MEVAGKRSRSGVRIPTLNIVFDQTARTRGRGDGLGRAIQIGVVVCLLRCGWQVVAAPNWEQGEGYRSAPVSVPAAGKPGFTLLNSRMTGITFTNLLSKDRYTTNQIYLNGSGVAAGDVDGDGWCDLYFCGLDGPNVLYRNLGNWRFEDITASAGVACPNLDATGAVFADIDGDGDLDLIVNSVGGGTHIFLNDGKGHFTETATLNEKRCGTSMALADMDGDGALDLYVGNYRVVTLRDQPKTSFHVNMVNGKPVVTTVNGIPTTTPELQGRFTLTAHGGILENGEPGAFYHNDGKGHFLPVPFTEGAFLDEDGKPISIPYDWTLSVMARDLNGDNAPDLYICNDFHSPDRIWINNGRGQFRALPRVALRNTSKFSMGMDVADINRDGHDDLFVLDMLSRDHVTRLTRMDRIMDGRPFGDVEARPQVTRNTLQLNRGDGTYADIAFLSHVEASSWSWTPIFLDVDLDGYEDLIICTGHSRDDMDLDVGMSIEAARKSNRLSPMEQLGLRRATPQIAGPKIAFRNRRDLTFEEVGRQWGFDDVGVSQGMALADLDNDGDLDVIVNSLNAPAGLYRNESNAPRIAVRLKGLAPNTRGIGAKIKVLGGPVTQSQEMICGGRYLSSDDTMRVFAAGTLTNALRIEVTWRSGQWSVVEHAHANRVYEVDEAGAVRRPASVVRGQSDAPQTTRTVEPGAKLTGSGQPATPLFEDVSSSLNHTHFEMPFDDFGRQPLLPNKLSQLGPGIAWFDLDGDGWEDLIIGSGKGGQLAAYRNNTKGGFTRLEGAPFSQAVTRDQTGIVGWRKASGQVVLLVGSANYEDGFAAGSCVRQYDLAAKKVEDTLPGQASSSGPLALGDIAGDGSLALFVGGRVIGGKYPEAASSMLFRERGGEWVLDPENTQLLKDVGLVSGAVWSDLDGDGYPELVLACEWGPVRVFANGHGKLREATKDWGLDKYPGWWNGVAVGDFDGDGKLDLVVSNWGRNTRYEDHRERPLRLWFGDLDGNGTTDLLEAYFEPGMKKYVPWRGLSPMAQAIPSLRERFTSHRAYAQLGVEEIFGDTLKQMKLWEAACLESTVFLNRGQRFTALALPIEAQFSPAFGINVGDFDGDGHEDVFLSQNFFGTCPEISEYDAGRGLLLKGNGAGEFTAVAGQESGIKVYGEQRGSAMADYDHDGRLDLVVTQNANQTKLYHNLAAQPGLRVRLLGPARNRDGVGACLRVKFGQSWGPMHEVHAGSGYWSQDASVQVLATPRPPDEIWVRWPGGKTFEAPLPAGAREILLSVDGKLSAVR
jgi:enediyne biosynthesis protein E4